MTKTGPKRPSTPAPPAPEPVAVIGKDWALHWASPDTLKSIVDRTGIKIGSLLYTRPPASEPIPEVAGVMKRLNERLGSVTSPLMEGDNLAILLCGIYDNPDQATEDDTGWTPDAVAGCDEVLDAIRAHYAPAAALLSAQAVMLEEAREALAPFATCAADWIPDDEDDEEWAKFRLLVKDFRRARSAHAKLEAGNV